MQVQNNTNVNFCGKSEIIYNLGEALRSAQLVERNRLLLSRSISAETKDEVLLNLGRLDGSLKAVVQDDVFGDFIFDIIKNGLDQDSQKLRTIANSTDQYIGSDNLKVRAQGFRLFSDSLLKKARECYLKPVFGRVCNLLRAIEPTIKPEDLDSATPEEIVEFTEAFALI